VIRIEIDEPTLARTRIATSPYGEACCSLYLLVRNPDPAPWPYTDLGMACGFFGLTLGALGLRFRDVWVV
jgi:hypothetical protein